VSITHSGVHSAAHILTELLAEVEETFVTADLDTEMQANVNPSSSRTEVPQLNNLMAYILKVTKCPDTTS
jgi:hypothetical protein